MAGELLSFFFRFLQLFFCLIAVIWSRTLHRARYECSAMHNTMCKVDIHHIKYRHEKYWVIEFKQALMTKWHQLLAGLNDEQRLMRFIIAVDREQGPFHCNSTHSTVCDHHRIRNKKKTNSQTSEEKFFLRVTFYVTFCTFSIGFLSKTYMCYTI